MKKFLSVLSIIGALSFASVSCAAGGPFSQSTTLATTTPMPVTIDSASCGNNGGGQVGLNGCQLPVYGTIAGFTPSGAYVNMSVGVTSSRVQLPPGASTVVIYNTGLNAAYINFSNTSGVTATTNNDVIQPGSWSAFTPGPNTYVAAITGSGSTSLTISGGSGLPIGGVGGSGGGGASSNVSVTNFPSTFAVPGTNSANAYAVQGVTGGTPVSTTDTNSSTISTNTTSIATNTSGAAKDATLTNQQATPGSDASKAIAVQGVTGGKAVSTTDTNGSSIATNTSNTASNTSTIASNTNGVAKDATLTNQQAVPGSNATKAIAVQGVSGAIAVSTTDTNSTAIASNTSSTATNTSAIATNTTSLVSNTNGLAKDTTLTNQQANAGSSASKAVAVQGISGGLALSTTDTNGSNIASNTSSIATNTSGVAKDATIGNQQATPGSDATKAVAVQGVTGGKAIPVSGSLSITGFTPGGSYASLSVTNSSSNVALPTGSSIVVYNTGANPAYIRLGNNTVTASTANDVIQPSSWISFTPGSFTYIAGITASNSTTLTISGGTGIPTGAGGGGSSGGSSTVAVTNFPATFANPGSNASNAYAVQGVSGGTAVSTTDTNGSTIAANTGTTATNTTTISSNTTALVTNTTGAAKDVTLASQQANPGVSSSKAVGVQGVTGGIPVSTTDSNGSAIATNTSNTATNTSSIATNTSGVAKDVTLTNQQAVAGSNASKAVAVQGISGGLALSTTDTNGSAIASNTSNTATNTSNTATNTSTIATNTSGAAKDVTLTNQQANPGVSASKAVGVQGVTGGLALSTTDTNGASIASNTASTVTNTTAISNSSSTTATNTTTIASSASTIATNTTGAAKDATLTAQQANPGFSASKAVAVQGVSGGIALSTTDTNSATINTNTSNTATNTSTISTTLTNEQASAGSNASKAMAVQGISGGVPVPVSGSLSATFNGFAPNEAYSSLPSVTTSSTSTTLPTGTSVIVYNTGANAAYVALGTGTLTATTTNDVLQPGSWMAFAVGTNTKIAAVTSSGGTSLLISGGAGVPTGAGGGASGSGGGGAITAANGAFVAGALSDGAITTQGLEADAACGTDNGTCTGQALLKRSNQRLTSIIAALGSPLQTGGSVVASNFPSTVSTGTGVQNVNSPRVTVATDSATVAGSAPGGFTQPVSGNVTVSGTVTANAGSGTFAHNLTQVAGTAVAVGAGAQSTGTQRVTVAQDSTTVAGSTPGSYTQPVSGTITANAGTGTFAHNLAQVAGISVPTGPGTAASGTQRIVVSQDSTTIAGATPGSFTQPISGSVGITTFQPNGNYTSLSNVGNVSSTNVLLPAGSTTVVVYNTGANTAYVKLGGSAVTTTTTSDAIPSGGWLAFTPGSNTYIAAITQTGTTNLTISGGSGLPAGIAGVGSGGGGPAAAITAAAGSYAAGALSDGASVTQGFQNDVACTTDNGTCTTQALIKRTNQRITSMISTLGTPMQATGGTVTANAGSGVFTTNSNQINGVTISTGTGAQGTGSQRVTVATDSATVAGSTPGGFTQPVSGTLSVNDFAPAASYSSPLAVSTTSNRVALPVGQPNVIVYNTGSNAAYVILGNASINATTSNDVIQPNSWMAFNVGGNVDLAAITSSGTTTLNISGGTGLASGSGGGGGSGGSGPTNVGGFSVQVSACASGISGCSVSFTENAGSYGSGAAIGGALALPLARSNGGTGTLTNIGFRSNAGLATTLWIYAWSKSPTSTCTNASTFVPNNADSPYALPGFPQSVTLGSTGSWDAATYGQINGVDSQFDNQDTTASNKVYICVVTASSVTGTASDLSIVVNALQD